MILGLKDVLECEIEFHSKSQECVIGNMGTELEDEGEEVEEEVEDIGDF